MKKTLVAVLGLSSFVIASGKVEFVNDANLTVLTPSVEENKMVDFNAEKDLKTTHKLKVNVKENNIFVEAELATSANLLEVDEHGKPVVRVEVAEGPKAPVEPKTKFIYNFGKSVTGYVKAGYDDGTVLGSVKYDFGKKETFLNGSYKYVDGKLTLKPNAELMLEVLDPAKLTLGNETTYKFDDMLLLKNETKVYTSVYGMKGENGNTVSLIGGNTKLGVEYKPTDEVKLLSNLFGKYETENVKAFSGSDKKVDDKNYGNKKAYEVSVDGKVEFKSNQVKGLKSDAKIKYAYTVNSGNASEEVAKYSTKSKKHSFELDSNISYDIDLTKGFELTPAFNLNYKADVNKVSDEITDTENEKYTGNGTTKGHVLTLKPNAKLGYKYDKFSTSLKVESPIEFSSLSIDLNNDDHATRLSNLDLVAKNFGFNKVGLKTTLSLEYKW